MTKNAQGAQKIYERNKASKMESVSGTGSTLQVTKPFRTWLGDIIQKYEIRSILDVPCGDWNWMQHVDLSGVDYLGYDIVPEIIEGNRQFESHTHGYNSVNFEVADIIHKTDLGRFDLIICRDFLFHLTIEQAQQVLENFEDSGSNYLISTTFDNGKNVDLTDKQRVDGWGWRPIDLHVEPFYFDEGLDAIQEPEMGARYQKLWKL